jgi:excisionase family DNA binding protein
MDSQTTVIRLRVNRAARRLGLSCRMVRHLAATGKLKATKAGKLWVFDPRDVDDECRRRCQDGHA